MIKCRAIDIQSYHFGVRDRLLIDANVWLYVYGPQADPRDRLTRIYSRALKAVLAARSEVFIDVLIISEFINRYSRLQAKIRSVPERDFKSFRNSPKFQPVARAIAADLSRIISQANTIGSGLDRIDLSTLLRDFGKHARDFNDLVLVEICRAKGLTMVTHDGDFGSFPITVLSANKKLLR